MPSCSSTIRKSADLTVEPAADHCAVALRERKVLVWFDGFVDNIVIPVATRHGGGDAFKPIETTREFAEFIRKAGDGKNANIELFRRLSEGGRQRSHSSQRAIHCRLPCALRRWPWLALTASGIQEIC
jgi:hypothetical protein